MDKRGVMGLGMSAGRGEAGGDVLAWAGFGTEREDEYVGGGGTLGEEADVAVDDEEEVEAAAVDDVDATVVVEAAVVREVVDAEAEGPPSEEPSMTWLIEGA